MSVKRFLVQGEPCPVESLLEGIADKIEINKTINSNLEQQARALFKSWFIDFEPFDGKMPNDWKIIKFSVFLSLRNEKSNNPLPPLLSVTDTGIYPREQMFSKRLSMANTKNKVIYKTDLVFGMSREILNWGIMRFPVGGVSPADVTIEVSDSDISDCTVTKDADGNGKIVITPHTEGADSFTVKAKNPNNANEEIGSYIITQKYFYDSLTVSYVKQKDVSYADSTKTAYWSNFASDAITLGDGEKMTFKFSVKETKTDSLSILAKLQSKKNSAIELSNGATSGQFILSHKTDTKKPAYKITTGYRPTYKEKTSYPDGTPIKFADFTATNSTDSDSYKDWQNPFYYETHYDRRAWWQLKNTATSSQVYEFDSGWIHSFSKIVTLSNKEDKNSDWGRVRDTSLDGKCIAVEGFQKNLWYYVPSFDIQMGGSCTSHMKHNYGEIDTDHISATYYEVTPDTSVVSSSQEDVLVVTFTHNGKSTTWK